MVSTQSTWGRVLPMLTAYLNPKRVNDEEGSPFIPPLREAGFKTAFVHGQEGLIYLQKKRVAAIQEEAITGVQHYTLMSSAVIGDDVICTVAIDDLEESPPNIQVVDAETFAVVSGVIAANLKKIATNIFPFPDRRGVVAPHRRRSRSVPGCAFRAPEGLGYIHHLQFGPLIDWLRENDGYIPMRAIQRKQKLLLREGAHATVEGERYNVKLSDGPHLVTGRVRRNQLNLIMHTPSMIGEIEKGKLPDYDGVWNDLLPTVQAALADDGATSILYWGNEDLYVKESDGENGHVFSNFRRLASGLVFPNTLYEKGGLTGQQWILTDDPDPLAIEFLRTQAYRIATMLQQETAMSVEGSPGTGKTNMKRVVESVRGVGGGVNIMDIDGVLTPENIQLLEESYRSGESVSSLMSMVQGWARDSFIPEEGLNIYFVHRADSVPCSSVQLQISESVEGNARARDIRAGTFSEALHAYYSGTTSITRAYLNSPVPPLAIIIGILLASSLR